MRHTAPVVILLLMLLAVGALWAAYPRQVSGTVLDGLDGQPVPDAVITVDGRVLSADREGHFELGWSWLTPTLTVEAEGYLMARAEVPRGRLPGEGVSLPMVLVRNTVQGTVRDAETGDSLAGSTVGLNGDWQTTNADGRYTLRRVQGGARLSVTMAGYQFNETVWDGNNTQDLLLVPTDTEVAVVDLYTGTPLAGAQVSCDGVQYTTDSRGIVVVKRLLEGAMLRASAGQHEGEEHPYAGDRGVSFELRPNTLRGLVRETSGRTPLAGAVIRAVAAGELITMTTTSADGSYLLEGLPASVSVTVTALDHEPFETAVERATELDIDLRRFEVRGIYIPLGLLTSERRINELIDLVDRTELNAVIVDMKNDRGWLAFPSALQESKRSRAYQPDCMDVQRFLALCKAKGIYTIARVVLFKDPSLVAAYPEWAVRTADGQVYEDTEGSTWCDPFRNEVQDYLIGIAKEVASLGFHELQFDYVRFPSDGSVGKAKYSQESNLESRTRTVREFCARLREELGPSGVVLSADLFGLTAWVEPEKDMGIGQRVIDIAPYMDYISPMLYPATFISGNLGLDQPLLYPYEVVYRSCVELAKRTSTRVRPWLQHYSWKGVEYGAEQMRLQKVAAEDADAYGWMFWHAGGKYIADSFDLNDKSVP